MRLLLIGYLVFFSLNLCSQATVIQKFFGDVTQEVGVNQLPWSNLPLSLSTCTPNALETTVTFDGVLTTSQVLEVSNVKVNLPAEFFNLTAITVTITRISSGAGSVTATVADLILDTNGTKTFVPIPGGNSVWENTLTAVPFVVTGNFDASQINSTLFGLRLEITGTNVTANETASISCIQFSVDFIESPPPVTTVAPTDVSTDASTTDVVVTTSEPVTVDTNVQTGGVTQNPDTSPAATPAPDPVVQKESPVATILGFPILTFGLIIGGAGLGFIILVTVVILAIVLSRKAVQRKRVRDAVYAMQTASSGMIPAKVMTMNDIQMNLMKQAPEGYY